MAQTTPPTITAAPAQAPQRSEKSTFSARLDAFVTWVFAAVSQFGAVATNVYNNAVDAFNSATAAAGSAGAAAGSAGAAAGSATQAAASAGAAAVGANSPAWASGTTYSIGQVVYSPVNFRSYRRKTAGAGTTDPSADATNWTQISNMAPGYSLLATITPTAATFVDLLSIFNSNYDSYLVVITGIKPSTDDTLVMRLAVANIVDSGANYALQASTGSVTLGAGATQANLTGSSGGARPTASAGRGLDASVSISNVNDSGTLKSIVSDFATNNTGYEAGAAYSVHTAANVATGLRLYWQAGANFAAQGKIRVYGVLNQVS